MTTNLAAIETDDLIEKCGQIDTEYVGRKASAYAIVYDFRVGIGVEILTKEVKMNVFSALNLLYRDLSLLKYLGAVCYCGRRGCMETLFFLKRTP